MFNGQFYPGQPIQFNSEQPFKNPWHRNTLIEIIQRQGLTSNLKLCLDAADSSSYSSGQSWLDRSGNGYDFFRGTTSGAEGSDPTFNGSAGGRSSSEYFSFDGGDVFTYDTTNETWMQNIHKNNALWSAAIWFYSPDVTSMGGLAGDTSTAGGNTGFNLTVTSGGYPGIRVNNAGSNVLNVSGGIGAGMTVPFVSNTWSFWAVSVDEAAGTGHFQGNADGGSFTSTYSSPAAGNATFTLQLGSRGNSNGILASGHRIASVSFWEGTALSSSQIQAIFRATRNRFGV